jgi:hypothetical protein
MKVSELTGSELDLWVGQAMGFAHTSAREAAFALDGQTEPRIFKTSSGDLRIAQADSITAWKPSTDWVCGGPIIEREQIELTLKSDPEARASEERPMLWCGHILHSSEEEPYGIGSTPLIAAMRAFVASKFSLLRNLGMKCWIRETRRTKRAKRGAARSAMPRTGNSKLGWSGRR